VNRSPRIARNVLDLVLNRFSVPFFSLALLVVIARQSSELLGWYAVVNVYFFALQTLPFLGLTPWIMREAARRPQDAAAIFGSSVGLAIGASITAARGGPARVAACASAIRCAEIVVRSRGTHHIIWPLPIAAGSSADLTGTVPLWRTKQSSSWISARSSRN
jgi:hypothetical protein